ncbi:MAG: hypothetical protein SF053_11845 [Bacteroidia bacterium]|nr:hypothetical protein [Bacteroidia bacterium]
MLTVYTTSDLIDALRTLIATPDQLDDWVTICDLSDGDPLPSAYHLKVTAREGIVHPVDWYNLLPPYLMPEYLPYRTEILLALLYQRLGNYEQAYRLLADHSVLLNDIDLINRLQQGLETDPASLTSDFQPFEEYRFCHNSAVLHHYGSPDPAAGGDKARYFYREALKAAPDAEYHAFTTRQYAILLADAGELTQAAHVLEEAVRLQPSADAQAELKAGLTQIWMLQLAVPYDAVLLETLKHTLWEVLQHYRLRGREVEEAMVLVDAAQIANYADSFAESLGYINRAVELLREADLPELLAQAHYRRGILLYTWAQQGQPQFFRSALDSFQETMKVFTREDAPALFAEIHQYLGVIYAEMPDEPQKRAIWAGVSASAFQTALAFFTREDYPYEYARICAQYANALNQYPDAVHTDNRQKALAYYQESLAIRTATRWPVERAVTLLNYVGTAWHLNLTDNAAAEALYGEMVAMAREARDLTDDPKIISEAVLHLSKLNQLRDTLAEGPHTAASPTNN